MTFIKNWQANTEVNSQINQSQEWNTEQIFQLMDSMLSIEACLYHQVLPLAIEANCLKLGMVNLDDTAAVDYVKQIVRHLNYPLLLQPIAAADLQALLSEYLNYTRVSQSAANQLSAIATAHSVTQAATKPDVSINQNDRPTLILVDREALKDLPSSTPAATEENNQRNNSQIAKALPDLKVQAVHLSSPTEVLAKLPSKQLLQELLGRVLAAGIGRLYFEPLSPKYGRIIYSQNGKLRSVLESVPLHVFQEAINELKRLTHLPLTQVQEPKQIEIERFYKQDRILLRLLVMPGVSSEKATLQVLRGEALKFYQQQQMAHLSRDTVAIATQLQRKLNQLRSRANSNPNQNYGQLTSLYALNQLLESVDQNLENLKQLQD